MGQTHIYISLFIKKKTGEGIKGITKNYLTAPSPDRLLRPSPAAITPAAGDSSDPSPSLRPLLFLSLPLSFLPRSHLSSSLPLLSGPRWQFAGGSRRLFLPVYVIARYSSPHSSYSFHLYPNCILFAFVLNTGVLNF